MLYSHAGYATNAMMDLLAVTPDIDLPAQVCMHVCNCASGQNEGMPAGLYLVIQAN